MKEFLLKIIKKLHLQKPVYFFLKYFFNGKAALSAAKANELLREFYPSPEGFAIRNNNIKEAKYDLTVIIAAYNAEKYIEECVNSVLSQKTEYSYKVKITDDGSTDKTRDILKNYKSDIIEIITKKNGGAASARNRALETIESKYVMFLDADDTLEENAVEVFLRNAYKYDADVVECGYYFFDDEKRFIGKKNCASVTDSALGVMSGFTCMKIYKSSFFEKISFPEGYWFEDSVIAMLLFPQTGKAVTLSEVLYNYRLNEGSMTAIAAKSKKSVDSFWVMKNLLCEAKTVGIDMSPEYYKQILRQIAITFKRTMGLPKKVRESIFVLSVELLKKYFTDFYSVNDYWYDELTASFKTGNYKKYELICTLNDSI